MIMKRNETAERLIELLLQESGTEKGRAIILRVVCAVDDDRAKKVVSECEELLSYNQYLTREEAENAVSSFVNFDGSKGAHWPNIGSIENLLASRDMPIDVRPNYNRWAWYAAMNMVWSDEWGALSEHVPQEDEAAVCAGITKARLLDPDNKFNVRRYFCVD